jgi:protein-S-isoprenylcysteine O-methyltransferase Ste14
MNKRKLAESPMNRHLLLIAALLCVFGLGLAVGWLYPAAVVLLLIVLAAVVALLLVESFYLWRQPGCKKQVKKLSVSKRSVKQ